MIPMNSNIKSISIRKLIDPDRDNCFFFCFFKRVSLRLSIFRGGAVNAFV